MSTITDRRRSPKTRPSYLQNFPVPPRPDDLVSAFLIAHAVRTGKELHIKRDGTTTIDGIPMAEFFTPGKNPAVDRNAPPANGCSNIFRLEEGCWRLKCAGIEVARQPYSVGLHYCHELITRVYRDVSSSQLVVLVNGEAVDAVNEEDLVGSNIATYEVPSPSGNGNTETRCVTAEFYDQIMSKEDRDRMSQALERLKELAATFRANGKADDAITSQEEAEQVQAWMDKHAPCRDTAYFDNELTRNRKSVCNAIARTVNGLQRSHPLLGAHLRMSITTGLFCSYCPETPTPWVL